MDRPLLLIDVQKERDVVCIQLRRTRLDEAELTALMDELLHVVELHPGSNIILSLGPEEPVFLYSVFLAKLVRFQRRIRAAGGHLKIADASANVLEIFQACHLDHLFDIHADKAAALAAFAAA